jgi:tetratricopeptide (TPR) repeat protein
MAKRKKKEESSEVLIDLVETRDKAQSFVEKNQVAVFGALVAVVALIGIFVVWKGMILPGKQDKALAAIYKAEEQFAKDSFNLALTEPFLGEMGLNQFVNEYGTDTKNVGNYYRGISYMKQGDFQTAADILSKVKDDGELLSIMKHGTLGDCYSELGQLDKALAEYKKASKAGSVESVTPIYLIRLGLLNEKQGNTDAAKAAYQEVVSSYPNSAQLSNAEKFLARL